MVAETRPVPHGLGHRPLARFSPTLAEQENPKISHSIRSLGRNLRTIARKHRITGQAACAGNRRERTIALVERWVGQTALASRTGPQRGHRHWSLEVLAREFLLQSGLGHIPLVGSSLKPFLFGMASKEHCFGDRKIPMLSERGFPPPWAVTYTDHECDLPVLELSKECFLINPKPRAIQLVTEKLSCRPKILAWQ